MLKILSLPPSNVFKTKFLPFIVKWILFLPRNEQDMSSNMKAQIIHVPSLQKVTMTTNSFHLMGIYQCKVSISLPIESTVNYINWVMLILNCIKNKVLSKTKLLSTVYTLLTLRQLFLYNKSHMNIFFCRWFNAVGTTCI